MRRACFGCPISGTDIMKSKTIQARLFDRDRKNKLFIICQFHNFYSFADLSVSSFLSVLQPKLLSSFLQLVAAAGLAAQFLWAITSPHGRCLAKCIARRLHANHTPIIRFPTSSLVSCPKHECSGLFNLSECSRHKPLVVLTWCG